MDQKKFSIVDVQAEDWAEVIETAIRERWKQFCVFPPGWSNLRIQSYLSELNLGSSFSVHRGRIRTGILASLSRDLLTLIAIEQYIGDTGAQAIAENLTQLTTLDID